MAFAMIEGLSREKTAETMLYPSVESAEQCPNQSIDLS